MTEFSATGLLEVQADPQSLRAARADIEQELGDITVSVDASASGQLANSASGGGSGGRNPRRQLLDQSNTYLNTATDQLDDGLTLDETRNDLLREMLDVQEATAQGGGNSLRPRPRSMGGGLAGGAVLAAGLVAGLASVNWSGVIGGAIPDINAGQLVNQAALTASDVVSPVSLSPSAVIASAATLTPGAVVSSAALSASDVVSPVALSASDVVTAVSLAATDVVSAVTLTAAALIASKAAIKPPDIITAPVELVPSDLVKPTERPGGDGTGSGSGSGGELPEPLELIAATVTGGAAGALSNSGIGSAIGNAGSAARSFNPAGLLTASFTSEAFTDRDIPNNLVTQSPGIPDPSPSGPVTDYLTSPYSALQEIGAPSLDDPGSPYSDAPGNGGGVSVTINNTTQVDGNGGNDGRDVERVVEEKLRDFERDLSGRLGL